MITVKKSILWKALTHHITTGANVKPIQCQTHWGLKFQWTLGPVLWERPPSHNGGSMGTIVLSRRSDSLAISYWSGVNNRLTWLIIFLQECEPRGRACACILSPFNHKALVKHP